jgi:hypothetical protein
MSLTSYRAAPPRGVCEGAGKRGHDPGDRGLRWEDLAATYSPAPWGAVPSALGDFTAEFGMGSGAGPPAKATRSSDRSGRSLRMGMRRAAGRRPGPAGGPASALRATRDQADRAIRTGRLHALPRVHPRPINVVVSHGPQARPGFEEGFPLRCLQRLSRPHLATRRCGWRHNRCTRGASIPVLSY